VTRTRTIAKQEEALRAVLLISLVAVTGVCSAAGAGATPARSTCTPGSKSIKGHKAVVVCGPATASLHIGGRSYSFKSGTCIWAGSLILTLGTQVNGVPASANNEGAVLLQLTDATGTGIVYASSGRLHLGLSIVKVQAHGHSNGTFKGREPIGATRRFTGSYRC
jgi:hypothetical protein